MALESLEARLVLSSVTVVSHGASILGSGGPLEEMGEELYNYWSSQGSSGLYSYESATGDLDLVSGSGLGTAENTVIVFNWEAESDAPAPGFDEAAGDALYAMLREHSLVSSDYLHLIGHSRGAIVVSEAAQRLLSDGLSVNHVTFLDHEAGPAPYNAAGDPFAWQGVNFVDNYYGAGTAGLQGAPVVGAHNLDLPDLGHTEVRQWYSQSITDIANGVVRTDGFRWRVATQDQATAPVQGARTPLASVPDIVNGDFSYGHGITLFSDRLAGWDFQGGSGDADVANGVLDLSFAEVTRTHNRMYIPQDATCLSLDLFVPDQSDNDSFRILIGDEEIGSFALAPADPANAAPYFSRFETVGITIPARFRNTVNTLTVEISAPGALNVVDANVQIDNLEFGGACGVTIVTVIDRSSSMSGTKIVEARNAASLFVDFLRTGDTIGVASYSTSGSINFPLEAIANNDVRTRAQAAIAAIGTSGATSIGAGIQVADDELDRFADNPARAIILMTDGQQNTDPDPMTVIDSQVDSDIRVFTIGFGAGADNKLLAELAAKRNGQFYFAPSGPQLQQIYTQLLGEIAQQQRALNVNGDIQPGETKTTQFLLDPTVGATTIGLNWTGSDLDLELVAPDGSVITHAEAAVDPNIDLFEGETFESIRLNRPLTGVWTVRVVAVDVPPEGEPYNLFVTTDSSVQSDVRILDPDTSETKLSFETGDEAVIQLSLTDGRPVTGATVVATLTSPNDGSQSVTLFDDGTHDDGTANDGVYGNRLTLQRPGALNLEVQATGTTNGGFETQIVELASLFATGELMVTTGSIHGRKFNDLNANGTRDADEPWLNGWTVELVNSAGVVVATASTADIDLDENGTIDSSLERGVYRFDALASGQYNVREVVKSGWSQSYPTSPIATLASSLDVANQFRTTANNFQDWAGLNERWLYSNNGWHYVTPAGGLFKWTSGRGATLQSQFVAKLNPDYYNDLNLLASPAAPQAHQVTITTGSQVTGIDFGNYGASTIQGQKWEDSDADGVRDSAERFLNGWEIQLIDSATGNVVASTMTQNMDQNLDGLIDPQTEVGVYYFAGVVPGKYEVREVLKAGWIQSTPTQDLLAMAHDLDTSREFQTKNGDFLNWGNLSEKWVLGNDGWYYITPDGALTKWNQSPRTALTGTKVAQLSPWFYSQTSRLTDAVDPSDVLIDTTSEVHVTGADLGNYRANGANGLKVSGKYDPTFVPGNVTVTVSRGDVRIVGDKWDNQVGLFVDWNHNLIAVGLQGTTVNGKSGAVTLFTNSATLTGSVIVELNGGDDLIALQGFKTGKNVSINGGIGEDSVFALDLQVGGNFDVLSSWGAGTVVLSKTSIANNLTIWGSEAQDDIVLDQVVVSNRTNIQLGAAADRLIARRSVFHDDASINLGLGNDAVIALGTNDFKRLLRVNGSAGSDAASASSVPAGRKVFLGIESNQVPNLTGVLDQVLSELATLGLDDLLLN